MILEGWTVEIFHSRVASRTNACFGFYKLLSISSVDGDLHGIFLLGCYAGLEFCMIY